MFDATIDLNWDQKVVADVYNKSCFVCTLIHCSIMVTKSYCIVISEREIFMKQCTNTAPTSIKYMLISIGDILEGTHFLKTMHIYLVLMIEEQRFTKHFHQYIQTRKFAQGILFFKPSLLKSCTICATPKTVLY